MVKAEIRCPGASRVSRFAQPCMLGIVRRSNIPDSLPQASPPRVRPARNAKAAEVRPAPSAWSGSRPDLGQGFGLVACLEPSQRPWPGAAIRRREWMSDPPRVAEDLIAARLGRKLSILCVDSRQGTIALEDHLKWIGMRANTEVSA